MGVAVNSFRIVVVVIVVDRGVLLWRTKGWKRNSKRMNKGEKRLPKSKNKMIRREQETNHAAVVIAIIEGQAYPPTSYNIHAIVTTITTSINFTSPYNIKVR
jgi:hypothetical protein